MKTKENGWIPCTERMPGPDDYDDFREVYAFGPASGVRRMPARTDLRVEGFTHWKRTGVVRPLPPALPETPENDLGGALEAAGRTAPSCPRCHVELQPGVVLAYTKAGCFSQSDAKLMECRKCPACGRSDVPGLQPRWDRGEGSGS